MRRLLATAATAAALLAGCSDSDERSTTTTPEELAPVEELEAAAETATNEKLITDSAVKLATVEDSGAIKELQADLKQAGQEAEAAAVALDPSQAQRLLDRAGQSLARASDELSQTAGALAKALAADSADLDVSEEAQARLANAARAVKRYTIRVQAAGDALASASHQLSQTLRRLAGDQALSVGEQTRLRKLREGVKSLDDRAKEAMPGLAQTISSLASRLRQRSGELTPEPPDVILDCASGYETVSALSVRNLSCAEADPLVLQAIQALAPSFTVGAYSCSILGDYGPQDGGPILGASDIRCESGDQAFRFSFAD